MGQNWHVDHRGDIRASDVGAMTVIRRPPGEIRATEKGTPMRIWEPPGEIRATEKGTPMRIWDHRGEIRRRMAGGVRRQLASFGSAVTEGRSKRLQGDALRPYHRPRRQVLPSKFGSLAMLLAMRLASSSVSAKKPLPVTRNTGQRHQSKGTQAAQFRLIRHGRPPS